MCSDGRTPEEKTKQILGIAAILPGQSPRRKFSIPQRRSVDRVPTRDDFTTQANESQSPSSKLGSPNGTLTDQPLSKVQTGGRPHAVSVAHSEMPSIQQEPPGFLVNNATGGQKGLTDKMQQLNVGESDLKTPAATVISQDPSPGIERQDSETGEVDEFQDAED